MSSKPTGLTCTLCGRTDPHSHKLGEWQALKEKPQPAQTIQYLDPNIIREEDPRMKIKLS